MANVNLGAAYITVFPVMKGIRKTISKELSGAGKEGAAALQKSVDSVGGSLGQRLKTAFTGQASTLGDAALKGLQSNVAKAEAAMSKALRTAADDQGKVRTAQAKLAEAREKYAAGSSKVVAAEERLAAAERKAAESLQIADAKARATGEAYKALKQASDSAASSGTSFAQKISSTFSNLQSKIANTDIFIGLQNDIGNLTSLVGSGFNKAWSLIPSGLTGALGSVTSSISSMASGLPSFVSGGLSALHSTFSDAFDGIAGLAAAAGSAIAGGIVSNLNMAVKRIDTFRNFPKVIQQFGFSADEAAKMVQDISDGLDTLPLRLDDVLQNLMAFAPSLTRAGFSAEQLTDFTLGLSQALLAGGATTQETNAAILQFSQALNKGKMDQMEWNSLISAMPAQLDQAAVALLGAGSTAQDLRDAMKAGEISVADFAAYFAASAAETKTQAEDMTGGIGTAMYKLQTGFGKAGQYMLEPFAEDITHAAETAKQKIEELGKTVGGKLSELRETMSNSDTGAGGFLANIGATLATLTGGMPIVTGLVGVFSSLAGMIPKVGAVFSTMGGAVGGVLGRLGASAGGLLKPLAGLVARIPMFGGALSKLLGPAGFVISLFVSMWQNSARLRLAIAQLIQHVKWAAAGFGGEGGEGLSGALQKISDVGGKVAGVLGDVLAKVISQVIVPLIPKIINLIQTLIPIVAKIIEIVGQVVSFVFEHVGPVVVAVIGWIANLIVNIAQFAANVIGWVVNIVDHVKNGFDSVVNAITTAKDWIVNKFWEIVNNVKQVFSDFKAQWDQSVAYAKERISALIESVKTIPSRVKNALSNAGQWLKDTGRRIIDGLINGVKEKLGALRDTLTGGVSDAVSSVTGFLGIHSPSRLMANKVGAPLAEGIAVGVSKATPGMIRNINRDLAGVEKLAYRVPVNYGGVANRSVAAKAGGIMAYSSAGTPQKVVNQTVNVRATDTNSVLAVLESRQRAALGT